MVDIGEALREAWCRDYDIWVVGFIKHKQKKERWFRGYFGAAMALFYRYQDKYKSAYCYRMRPPKVLIKEAVSATNPMFERLIGRR